MNDVMIPKKELLDWLLGCRLQHGDHTQYSTVQAKIKQKYPDPQPQLWWRRKWATYDRENPEREGSPSWAPTKFEFDNENGYKAPWSKEWESRTFEPES